MSSAPKLPMHVGLFVTCLVDMFRPTVGFSAVKLLEETGCVVHVPQAQSCCGQPAFNNGDLADAKAVAMTVLTAFADYDYIVVPSGSCGGMIKLHYPELFADDVVWGPVANRIAAKTFELVSFLVDVLGVTSVQAAFEGSVTYHDSCSGLRELGIKHQPRQLLASVEGLTLTEMTEPEICCGFGGTFCVKYGEVSNAIVEKKTQDIGATDASTLLAGDMGCLMNMQGKLKREGSPVQVRHVAEVLAGLSNGPAIGESVAKK